MSKRRKDKTKFADLARQQKPEQPASAPALNLGFQQASTVLTRDFLRVQIIVVGCGGIGAYVVQHVSRLMKVIYEDQRGVNLTLVDPDVVEEKNLGRQLFCDAEVGMPKAVALARRYGSVWGLNTMAFEGQYSDRLLLDEVDLNILVGCVDNAAARKTLHDTLTRNPDRISEHSLPKTWWLDCGNLKDTGRVCLGSAHSDEQVRGAFIEKKRCIALPSPALQYPTLLIPQADERRDENMSCADLQLANLQSLNINAAIAIQAVDMLTRLLMTGDLKRYQCAVNLLSGSVKSFYCTPEEIAREIDRDVEFVRKPEGVDVYEVDRVVRQQLREMIAGEAVA